MFNLEYDNFFYDGENVELAKALDPEGKDLLQTYDRDKLFCPECHVAQLKFTHGTSSRRAYLSLKQGTAYNPNEHTKICSHRMPKATKAQTIQYYKSLSEDQVIDKLKAAINRYLRNDSRLNAKTSLPQSKNNPAIASIEKNGQQIHRRLPTRSIYSIYEITDDELNIPILLYGEVKLSVEENKSKYEGGRPYYRLWIRDKESNRKIRFFYRGPIKDDIIENTVYYVSMIVVFKKHKPFPWSELYNANAILYIRR